MPGNRKELRLRQTRKFLDSVDIHVDSAIKESEELRDESKYETLKHNLQMDLTQHFANSKIIFYGSRINGLATKESDLDILIEIGNASRKLKSFQ